MEVRQGDVFWISPNEENKIASDHIHPHVVVQKETSGTILVCALTTNLKQAKAPGNVLLEEGEANLPKQSVVAVSQVSTVDKTQLGEYIGTLSETRIYQVLAGMRFLEKMTERHTEMDDRPWTIVHHPEFTGRKNLCQRKAVKGY